MAIGKDSVYLGETSLQEICAKNVQSTRVPRFGNYKLSSNQIRLFSTEYLPILYYDFIWFLSQLIADCFIDIESSVIRYI